MGEEKRNASWFWSHWTCICSHRTENTRTPVSDKIEDAHKATSLNCQQLTAIHCRYALASRHKTTEFSWSVPFNRKEVKFSKCYKEYKRYDIWDVLSKRFPWLTHKNSAKRKVVHKLCLWGGCCFVLFTLITFWGWAVSTKG